MNQAPRKLGAVTGTETVVLGLCGPQADETASVDREVPDSTSRRFSGLGHSAPVG